MEKLLKALKASIDVVTVARIFQAVKSKQWGGEKMNEKQIEIVVNFAAKDYELVAKFWQSN